jgi:hypothetical protein
MKIRPVGAELFHTDGHDEASSRFSQFCESAQKTFELLLLLVIPVVCVTTPAHNHNIPNPTLPLLLSIYMYIQSSSNQYQREAFS